MSLGDVHLQDSGRIGPELNVRDWGASDTRREAGIRINHKREKLITGGARRVTLDGHHRIDHVASIADDFERLPKVCPLRAIKEATAIRATRHCER